MKKVASKVKITVQDEWKEVNIYVTDDGNLVIDGLEDADGFTHEFEDNELLLSFNID